MDVAHEKVHQYEHFLNNVLRSDLKKVLDERDGIYGKIAEYLQLKNTIERLQESHPDGGLLKTKVDLGCNFYVKAKVHDTSKIFVSVGFGFFVEFTHNEALKFIDKKTKMLYDEAEKCTKNSSKIKAQIKLVLEGLRELQNIDPEVYKARRDIFI